MTRPTLILTRPVADGASWQDFFQAQGWSTLSWPLIEIQALATPENRLLMAWQTLAEHQAAMFVSRAAAQHFFAARPLGLTWPQHTRAWCTGPGTRQALLDQGLAQGQIDQPAPGASLDTEHLWPVVQAQIKPEGRVLFVRGTDADPQNARQGAAGVGRDWLAQQVTAQGAQVAWAIAYRRACPIWDRRQIERAQAAAVDGSIWLFSSAQALVHLQSLLPQQVWTRAAAVATHPRIGAQAQAMGFQPVWTCTPQPSAILALLKSLS